MEIWTIGHSTRTTEKFLELITSFKIQLVADVRSFPGSRRYPHFNREALELFLKKNGIKYIHLPELGGRRKPKPDSVNEGWRNAGFRGFADYMQTEAFKNAIEKLELLAGKERTAFMCAEAPWWKCHRSLISDYLKSNAWTVLHIMDVGKDQEHPYTAPAKISGGKLSYL